MSRLLCLMPLLFIASAALAQTAHEHDACARDVARLCRAVMGDGDQAVLACLQQHRSRVSRRCEKLMAEHGQ